MTKLCLVDDSGHCEDSKELRTPIHDARGIFVTYVCPKCKSDKLSGYRKDIFTDSNYWHDEPI